MFDQSDLYINMGVTILLTAIKNPEKAQKFKAALLKIRNAISAAFPGE